MSDSDDNFAANEQTCMEIEEQSQSVVDDSEAIPEVEENEETKNEKVPLTEKERIDFQKEVDKVFTINALSDEEWKLVDVLVKYVFHTVEPAGHSGSVNTSKALEYLTGSTKTHKGWSDLCADEENQKIVEKYFQLQNIDKDDENLELSAVQAKELIVKLWDKADIKMLGKSYHKKAEKTGQKWYLINIGTGYKKAGQTKAEAKSDDEEEEEEGKIEEIEDTLTHKDIDNKKDEIEQKIRWRNSYKIATCGAKKTKYVRDTWTVKQLTDFIKKAFTHAFQIDPNPARTILYYSGQADTEGQWVCSDGVVTMKQVLDLAVEADLYGHLEIHQDSDYSGKSCYAAKKWCDENPKDNREEDIVKSVQLVCNTHQDFTEEKGKHGEMYLKTKTSESMVKARREMDKKNYYKVYGKTKFDSSKKESDKQIQEVKPTEHPSQKQEEKE